MYFVYEHTLNSIFLKKDTIFFKHIKSERIGIRAYNHESGSFFVVGVKVSNSTLVNSAKVVSDLS